MIRLSIIIPAYNAAQYVERCLLSINNEAIRSGISQSEYEIIIVDDCSSDNTIERTLEYFNHLNLSNGKVICHHTNRKQGAARNTGLRVANGDYVWFVDIDDSIGDGILKYLHSSELSSTPDIFQFHAASKDQSNNIVIEPYWEKPIGPMSGIDYLEFEAMNAYSNRIRASWSKWFRREYLLCNNLFYEEGVFWEDVVHTLKAFYLADTVIYHPVIGYIYIQTPNSDMRGVQSGKKYADTIRFCTQSLQFLLEKHASPNIKNHLSSYYLKVLRKYKNYLSKLTETEIDAFIEAINDLKMNVIEQFFGNKEHDWLLNDSSIRELYNHQRK